MRAASLAFQQWRWADGERALRAAIAMNSTQAFALDLLGNMLRVEGRFSAALAAEHGASRFTWAAQEVPDGTYPDE